MRRVGTDGRYSSAEQRLVELAPQPDADRPTGPSSTRVHDRCSADPRRSRHAATTGRASPPMRLRRHAPVGSPYVPGAASPARSTRCTTTSLTGQARGRHPAPRRLGPGPQRLARHVRPGLLRHRDDGGRRRPLRPGPLRHGGLPGLAPPGRPDDRGRPGLPEDGPRPAPHLRPDDGAQVGHLHGRVRQLGRDVQQLRHRAGRRPDRPRRRLRARLPARSRDPAARHPHPARHDPQSGEVARAAQGQRAGRRGADRPSGTASPPR